MYINSLWGVSVHVEHKRGSFVHKIFPYQRSLIVGTVWRHAPIGLATAMASHLRTPARSKSF